MVYRPDVVTVEERRESPFDHLPVRQHVADAARDPQVVFEHGEAAVRDPHEVRARDSDVDVARHPDALHLAAKVLAAVDEMPRHDPVRQDARLAVEVFQKEIEGGQALGEAALDHLPLGRGDDPRNQIVGKDALGPFALAVDSECDALVQEGEVRRRLALVQPGGIQLAQTSPDLGVLAARGAVGGEHFVVRLTERIRLEPLPGLWRPVAGGNLGRHFQPSKPVAFLRCQARCQVPGAEVPGAGTGAKVPVPGAGCQVNAAS